MVLYSQGSNFARAKKVAIETMNVEDLYLELYAFTTAAAIVGLVDRKIFVLLRDGRNVFGILRTFDQFANLVLQDAVERIYLDNDDDEDAKNDTAAKPQYAQAYRGVFMVRGENVVMMGELDIDREDDHLDERTQIPFGDAERRLAAKHRQRIVAELKRTQRLLQMGMVNDFVKLDLY